MPRQTSFQITEATEQQIAYLASRGYGTTTNIIRTAIDRMAQQEGHKTMKTYTITAEPTTGRDGKPAYKLVGEDGRDAQEGYPWASKDEAMKAAAQIWPSNSVWNGRRTRKGWEIDPDTNE